MKIIMTEKHYFGYFQGWTITIDGIKYPRTKGLVYTAKSPLQALGDCLRLDREGKLSKDVQPFPNEEAIR